MASLHIEHSITDLKTWTSAFEAFAETRRRAGVRAETVRCAEGDETSVVIDLEFDSTDQAYAFQHFLKTQVWAVPANSPALTGSPESKVLETVPLIGQSSRQTAPTRTEPP